MPSTARTTRTGAADDLFHRSWTTTTGSVLGTDTPTPGVALVAVGGYGRGDLAPHSDLDVLLVHLPDRTDTAARLAAELWYPVWDAGHRLDHSLRSLPEVLELADADLKVALGLLDTRHLAGDPHLTVRLRSEVLAAWRRGARRRMVDLAELTRRRHDMVGEVAHASVPDVKEGEGGLRDTTVLAALAATWLVDVPHGDLARAREGLLEVRDVLHTLTGRAQDRVAPDLWPDLAAGLDLPDALAAQVHVRSLGRRVAHLSRLVWRRLEAHLALPAHQAGGRRPALAQVAPGVAVSAGEVVLGAGARPVDDPTLLLRAAAEAAERGLGINPATVARLVRDAPPMPSTWPDEARSLMVRLLGAGEGLFEVWETLDETAALDRLLPEWESIRTLPHASGVHRWTVDRHVVETCRNAAGLIRDVARPDVLLVAALLHDIGKGEVGDHSRNGEPVARAVATRWGFAPDAVDAIGTLVREHLLLGELVTTHDPQDPATAALVADAVGDAETLDLLVALTRADAAAASAQAWTPWRQRLVTHLASSVRRHLRDGGVPPVPAPALHPDARDGWTVVEVEAEPHPGSGDPVQVVRLSAPDRVGLAADAAALLAFNRARVLQARLWTVPGAAGDVGVSEWRVAGTVLDPAVLRTRFTAITLGAALPESRSWAPRAGDLPPLVALVPGAGPTPGDGTVLQVRAADRPGLVHRVLQVLAGQGLSVVSAHVSSWGPQAVDVFHLRRDNAALSPELADRVVRAVADALTPPGATAAR